MKFFVLVILLVALLVALVGNVLVSSGLLELSPSPRWEYRVGSIADDQLETQLTVLGDEGWQLAFARRAISNSGYSSEGIYEFIFMREKK